MDDQRCELPAAAAPVVATKVKHTSNKNKKKGAQNTASLKPPSEMKPSASTEDLFDILQRVQGNGIEEQRFEMPQLPGLDPNGKIV